VQLKKACIGFMSSRGVLAQIRETEDFKHLVLSCPTILEEIMDRAAAANGRVAKRARRSWAARNLSTPWFCSIDTKRNKLCKAWFRHIYRSVLLHWQHRLMTLYVCIILPYRLRHVSWTHVFCIRCQLVAFEMEFPSVCGKRSMIRIFRG
jgi:hypothetical protein